MSTENVTSTGRTYWLSFCDADRPEGEQFLGVAVVEVDNIDRHDARVEDYVRERRGPTGPPPDDEALWLTAAMAKAWETGCNPGGQMLSFDMTSLRDTEELKRTPRHVLLSRADLDALGHEPLSAGEVDALHG